MYVYVSDRRVDRLLGFSVSHLQNGNNNRKFMENGTK